MCARQCVRVRGAGAGACLPRLPSHAAAAPGAGWGERSRCRPVLAGRLGSLAGRQRVAAAPAPAAAARCVFPPSVPNALVLTPARPCPAPLPLHLVCLAGVVPGAQGTAVSRRPYRGARAGTRRRAAHPAARVRGAAGAANRHQGVLPQPMRELLGVVGRCVAPGPWLAAAPALPCPAGCPYLVSRPASSRARARAVSSPAVFVPASSCSLLPPVVQPLPTCFPLALHAPVTCAGQPLCDQAAIVRRQRVGLVVSRNSPAQQRR